MKEINRGFAVFIILIIAVSSLSILMVHSTSAQSIPKPSTPNFTLQIVDYGVQIKIQNQPIISNGHDTANIFYNIRLKSHDSENWVNTTIPNPTQGIRGYIGEIGTTGSTTILKDFNSIDVLLGLSYDFHQIDFQVEAINGYLNTNNGPLIGSDPNSRPVIIVNTSGWSNTQTITIPETSTSPNPTSPTSLIPTTATPTPTPTTATPTPTPTAPNTNSDSTNSITLPLSIFVVIIVIIAVIAVLALAISVLAYRRNRKPFSQTNPTFKEKKHKLNFK
jgi:hypothetical protein